jgi:hypothetical protein
MVMFGKDTFYPMTRTGSDLRQVLLQKKGTIVILVECIVQVMSGRGVNNMIEMFPLIFKERVYSYCTPKIFHLFCLNWL